MLEVLKFSFELNQDPGQISSNLDWEPTLRLKYDRVLFEQFDAEKKGKIIFRETVCEINFMYAIIFTE